MCQVNEFSKQKLFTAHYASQRVQDFRQDYKQLGSIRAANRSVPWIALTHNASEDVFNDIAENLQLLKPIATFKKSSFRKNIYYDVIFKNTILDVFTHLKDFVISRQDKYDKSVNIEFYPFVNG